MDNGGGHPVDQSIMFKHVLALLTVLSYMERDGVMDAVKCVTSESGRRLMTHPSLSREWFRLVLENKPRRGRREALRLCRPVIQ
jgi:hypothetical protein